MSPRSVLIGAIALAAALLAAPLTAGQTGAPAAMQQEALGGAKAEFARVVLFYGASSADVLRSKGVLKFNRIDTGRYCIRTEMNIEKAIPNVSVEWVQSTGSGVLAHWVHDAFSCPNNRRWIEVRTYAFTTAQTAILSDDVAFMLTVR